MATRRKLNDTQLIILSAAARNSGGAVLPLPKGMDISEEATARTLRQLLRRELVAEIAAGSGDEEWRRGDDGGPLTLTITDAGLSAIGLDEAEADAEGEADGGAGNRNGKIAPVNGDHVFPQNGSASAKDRPHSKVRARRKGKTRTSGSKGRASRTPPDDKKADESNLRPNAIAASGAKEVTFAAGTTAGAVVKLLQRKKGASIAELMEASGWQAHSVRGFLSGTLKKKRGMPIASQKDENGSRRYRIGS